MEFVMTDQINAQRKAELLSTTVEHIDIKSFDARPIIDQMGKMSFTSRDLARATGIYNQMLSDKDCTIFLVTSHDAQLLERPKTSTSARVASHKPSA